MTPDNKTTRWTRATLIILVVCSITLIIQACSISDQPILSLYPTQPQPTQELLDVDPLATVTFQVDVPLDTPADQPVMLSLLDEVTGLALNISRREMEKIGESTYTITLPFPVGSHIKYRYARQDNFIAEEHTTDRQPVRYRMYRVDGPGVVKDLISAWSDTQYDGSTGRIMGQVTNAEDGSPIPNLLVMAGGKQVVTSSTGDYLIDGLPPGLHNLVLYAFDGTFRTYQQGALVAANSTTPADVVLTPAPLVKLIFSVTVPDATLPAVPIRMAGNLEQLGNTFADLAGGINTVASRMPALTPLPNGSYALEIELPAGAFIEYKYTLGDGFWNTEYTPQGSFRLRTMTVPGSETVIQDTIDNWGQEFNAGPILFDLSVTETTPEFDYVSIQFSPFGWAEPIPMWKLEGNHWVYMLFSPLIEIDEFNYRYCRNDQCGRADDQLTPGYTHPGRSLEVSSGEGTITVNDTVDAWYWLDQIESQNESLPQDVPSKTGEFITGIELQTYYHPTLTPRLPVTFKEIESLQAGWVILSPTWTFTQQNPPVLGSVSGSDQSWNDLTVSVETARSFGLQVAYHPQPNFPVEMGEWWSSSTRDFPWWQVWFERYSHFIFSFADKAQLDGAQALVLGGDWISPSLPGGKLPDGSPSGVPADTERRWREIIAGVRERFDGQLFWALPADNKNITPPPFIENLDHVYLLWSIPLTGNTEYSQEQLLKVTGDYLDDEVFLLDVSLEMPITIAVAYPSAAGGLQGCIGVSDADGAETCLNPLLLEPPHPDDPDVSRDFQGQASAYAAILQAVSTRDWIDGFVSRGFYSPAQLQDKSNSIYGKPAADILNAWYTQWAPE